MEGEIGPRTSKHRTTIWRIYLLLHIAAVVAGALGSLDDSAVLKLQQGFGAALTVVSLPFLFISPIILVTMLGKAIFEPKKYALLALAELLLWGTHIFALLPTVQ